MLRELAINNEKHYSIDASRHEGVTGLAHAMGSAESCEGETPTMSVQATAMRGLRLGLWSSWFGRAKATRSYWPELPLKPGDVLTLRVLTEGVGDRPDRETDSRERVCLADVE
ncbi:MAG: hypothetical protein AMXMBFR84_08510 [Candidatus Hydrogenedentota bacterium]